MTVSNPSSTVFLEFIQKLLFPAGLKWAIDIHSFWLDTTILIIKDYNMWKLSLHFLDDFLEVLFYPQSAPSPRVTFWRNLTSP